MAKGTVLPGTDPRSGSSQGGIWVDETTGIGYFIFNSIGDSKIKGQWIVELDDTYLRMTNRSAQIIQAALVTQRFPFIYTHPSL